MKALAGAALLLALLSGCAGRTPQGHGTIDGPSIVPSALTAGAGSASLAAPLS